MTHFKIRTLLPHCFLIIALITGVSACSNLKFPGVYKIDIAQGNIVTQDLLDKLETGMQGNQVKYILGSPLVQDTFNPKRWDYYYSLKSGRTNQTKSSQVTVHFQEGSYTHYDIVGKIAASSIRREAKPAREKRKKFLWLF